MLHVITWHWGTIYSPKYVDRLRDGFKRHLTPPYRFDVSIPSQEDWHLTKIQGCFCRLRMFDPAWQLANGINPGDRLVCCDLDCIITGKLDPLFYRPEPFLILLGANASNPCRVNGSLWMLRAGYRPDVWSDFSLDAASRVPHFHFPDDQAWMDHKIPDAAGWEAGPRSGVYSFKKTTWPKGDDLPADARMVVFPGWRDPSKFTHLPWVQKHWQ